ncbi:glycosyltransferase family 39 protein [Pyrococcus kukulkanii]|uniref:ArnT family glycosyltransferase n=1 Tax=Pyrococcus kukulkanii TaxID=1609559 RepID=UPI00356A7427
MRKEITLILVVAVYFLLRVPLLFHFYGSFDYDEGTYLMIGKEFAEGTMPYRDIFTVHPPLYYILLALWFKVFPITYVWGRVLSLFLGLVSVILAYKIGEALGGRGILVTLIPALDLQTIFLNSLALHETLLELFVFLSVYLYVKGKPKLSAFVLGIGTSVKHTFLPFAAAMLMSMIVNVRVKRSIFKALVEAYLAYILIITPVAILYPYRLTKGIFPVPGFSSIEIIGAKYGLLTFLLLLTYFTLKEKAVEFDASRDLYKPFSLLSYAIIGKAIVELPFFILCGNEYVRDVYLANKGRGILFMGLPSALADVISNIRGSNFEMLYPYTFLFFLLLLYVAVGEKMVGDLAKTLFFGTLFYVLAPMPGAPRFVYPLILLAMMALSTSLRDPKKVTPFLVISLIFSATLPQGKLPVAFLNHEEILWELEVEGNAYSFNPMITFIYGIREPPYYIDNFGLLYLRKLDPGDFMKMLGNVSTIIVDTWLYSMLKKPGLGEKYREILDILHTNYTLTYAHSYSDGEVVEVYKKGSIKSLNIGTERGRLVLFYNGDKIVELSFHKNPISLKVVASGNDYAVVQDNTSVGISLMDSSLVIHAREAILKVPGNFTILNSTVFFGKYKIFVGGEIDAKNGYIEVKGREGKIIIKISTIP